VEAAPGVFYLFFLQYFGGFGQQHGCCFCLDSGTAVITAKLGDVDAAGSMTVNSTGQTVGPTIPAPTPTVDADSVISLFSNAYNNVNVDTWNTRWQFSTAE
jgi:hypothetical protein